MVVYVFQSTMDATVLDLSVIMQDGYPTAAGTNRLHIDVSPPSTVLYQCSVLDGGSVRSSAQLRARALGGTVHVG